MEARVPQGSVLYKSAPCPAVRSDPVTTANLEKPKAVKIPPQPPHIHTLSPFSGQHLNIALGKAEGDRERFPLRYHKISILWNF